MGNVETVRTGLTNSPLGKEVIVQDADDPSVMELVRRAGEGDCVAWESLVKRYIPLITWVALRYRVTDQDLADVSQTVWLQLVQHLPELRTPEALPGWIVTTTRNECFKVIKRRNRTFPVDTSTDERNPGGMAEAPDFDESLVREERHTALLAAFADLSDQHRALLTLLVADPQPTYQEISDRLGIPIGGIGPTRARALERLRCSPALAALMSADPTEGTAKRTRR